MTANQTGQRVIARDTEIDAGGIRLSPSTYEPPAASAPLQHGRLTPGPEESSIPVDWGVSATAESWTLSVGENGPLRDAEEVMSVEDWAEIRRLHRSGGMPIRAIARVMGVGRNTVRRALEADGPVICNYPEGSDAVELTAGRDRVWLRRELSSSV
jgi:hypothetical protein